MGAQAAILDATDEAALLAAVRSSSRAEREAAFRTLFEHYRVPILGVCLRIAGRRAEAEDALQETFVAVHRGLAGFRGDARLSTWIYRIAIREAVRQRARRRDDRNQPLDHDAAAPDAGDPAIRREESERLRRALGALSAEHRTVLSLFAVDGLSHKEIAAILGVPEGTVWSRLHAARKRLATQLSTRAGQ